MPFNNTLRHSGCPCRGCMERYAACHSECSKYAVWKATDEQRKHEQYLEDNKYKKVTWKRT